MGGQGLGGVKVRVCVCESESGQGWVEQMANAKGCPKRWGANG